MVKGDTPGQDKVDKRQFENLCGLHCTEAEICSFFDITDKTLTKWCKREYNMSFSEIYNKKRELGNISLRRNMFKQAEKNSTMAIWLSKQHLGMRDSFPDEVNYSEVNNTITNIANLLNNPVKNRNEDSLGE